MGTGFGKIILFGEHAVVYNRHVVAAPIPLAIEASVKKIDSGIIFKIPKWDIQQTLSTPDAAQASFEKLLWHILSKCGLDKLSMQIDVTPHIPRAVGLGGSAALAVAIIKAINHTFDLQLDNKKINQLAFECEKFAHGTPSGIDNTVACYGEFIIFKNKNYQTINPSKPLYFVISQTGQSSLTAEMVQKVKQAHENNPELIENILDNIDKISLDSVEYIQNNNLTKLGKLMDLNQGLLNSLGVSNTKIEELCELSRTAGALGAKLTGSGGGGSVIALCRDKQAQHKIKQIVNTNGYEALEVCIGG